jgi:hypothetical protein
MQRRHLPVITLRMVLWLLVIASAVVWSTLAFQAKGSTMRSGHGIVLLIPDANALPLPVTRAWLDAAQEEGLAVTPMTANEFIQAQANHTPMAGVLLPDSVHRQASDLLVNTLSQYVAQGGPLMVTFDAALFNLQTHAYADKSSRLSHLVGMRYGLYEQLQDDTIAQSPVYASRLAEQTLRIQPGKLDFGAHGAGDWSDWGELTTYAYPHLVYSHYLTEPLEPVQTLLRAEDDTPIVSTHVHGQGKVLFANLPLGYLKTRTDSYLLHRLLSFFASDMVRQPSLSATPQAQGGIVLNLHVDSNASQEPLAELERAGWFDDGPYSIHVTAGPDAIRAADGLGLNLSNNPWMQAFLKRQHAQGHEIGNHGGWVHNVYGYQADESNQREFEPYLDKNHASVSTTIDELAKVYSAPMGNQPSWATAWLANKGFKAYYATSDTGLGPTRSFIHERPSPHATLWTFPISNFKRIATFDEVQEQGMAEIEITDFIRLLLDHVSEQHMARLFYFHPAATPHFEKTLQTIQSEVKKLKAQGQFRWYSMAELSDFMNRRQDVQWQIRGPNAQGLQEISASSSSSLQDMTWVFPAHTAQDIRITEGQGTLRQNKDEWLLVAGPTPSLKVQWTRVP